MMHQFTRQEQHNPKIVESYYDWIYTLTRVTRKLELEGRVEITGGGNVGGSPTNGGQSGSNSNSADTSSTSKVTSTIHTIICTLFIMQLLQQ